MDTCAESAYSAPLAGLGEQQMFIAPSSKVLPTFLRTIRTVGLVMAVVILFALRLTEQLIITIAALLLMAFDIPDSPTQVISKPAPFAPKLEATVENGFDGDRFQIADPW
ncbi:MAG: hypothetical protein KME35_07170 [Aphanocapsa sp. GSE-SYN-MK-11-07L]|jgi:hypothetical protein|nr:hypothetical protein [Aphanocapsa sp. GSE-SYN-MK-11-07L]